MWARVSTAQIDPEKMNTVIDNLKKTPDLEGMTEALLLLDRERGQLMTVTIWESEAALRATAQAADKIREEVGEGSGITTPWQVFAYEVAYQSP